MSCLLGTFAGLSHKAHSLKGAVVAPYLRVCVLALLGLSLAFSLPRVCMGAVVQPTATNTDTPRSAPPPTPTGGKSHYTGAITPTNTATLGTERPAFSAVATASLPFGGLIHQDCVFTVARNAAFLQALREVALSLRKHTVASISAHELPRRMALAMAAYTPVVSKSITTLPDVKGKHFSTHGDDMLTVLVSLEAPLHLVDSRLRETMQHPETWELYATVLQQMQDYVRQGTDLITRAAALRQEHGAHMDEVFMNKTTVLADTLDALWMYMQILPKLRTVWDTPALVQQQMERALTLAPQVPLLWCALGEAQLQLDLPQKALDSLDKALQFDPTLARALYTRGLAHLRLQQVALAESDLTTAINLRPNTAHWLRARGAVRMVREEYGPMCEDFSAACALGDCDGLITARKRDLCQPQPPDLAPAGAPKTHAADSTAPSTLPKAPATVPSLPLAPARP